MRALSSNVHDTEIVSIDAANEPYLSIINGLCRHAACDAAALFGLSHSSGEITFIAAAPALSSEMTYHLARAVQTCLRDGLGGAADHDLPDNAAVKIIPLERDRQILGAAVLVWKDRSPQLSDDFRELELPLTSAALLLENRLLRADVAQTHDLSQALLTAARTIAELPSPQAVIEALRRTMLPPAVTNCTMLLFGPMVEAHSSRAPDYLEVQGSWSKRFDEGMGFGLRLYLGAYRDLLARLESESLIYFRDLTPEARSKFDPLVRGLLRVERVRSLVLLSLRSAQQQQGILAVASSKPHAFSAGDLHSFQVMANFLAVHAMTQHMIEQYDRIHQGRAVLLDSVREGVLFVAPGGSGGRVLTVNQVFKRLFNVTDMALENMTLEEILQMLELPEDVRRRLHVDWLSMPVRSPDVLKGEFKLAQIGGQPLDVEWSSAPVYRKGTAIGRLYTFHDVTADRAAVRLRAEYLSRISHELRTPLTTIHGFAEFILESAGDGLPPIAREYTQIILNSAKHLRTIINDIITITSADVGSIQLNTASIDLSELIADVTATLDLQLKERSQRLELALDESLPEVIVDVTRIIQVLSNLLVNASKYAPEGSVIRLSTGLVHSVNELPAYAPGDVILPSALITVLDEGHGVEPADLERLFMPFFRSEDVKRQRIEGVGLGLAVARSWVELHRGKIWAVPRPVAQGGCFQFTLPIPRE